MLHTMHSLRDNIQPTEKQFCLVPLSSIIIMILILRVKLVIYQWRNVIASVN